MGFLLFAARKLQLKRQINQLQFRQMQLSQEQQQISEQISQQQQKQQQVQNSLNYINTISNSLAGIQQATQLQSAYTNGSIPATAITSLFNNNVNPTTLATNVMNSVFTAQNNMQLAQLQGKDSQISLELENTESQLKLLQAEYENVKKAESSEAQNCAPTFGLA